MSSEMDLAWFRQECNDFFNLCGEEYAWLGMPGERVIDRALQGLSVSFIKAKLTGKEEMASAQAAYNGVVTNFHLRDIIMATRMQKVPPMGVA